MSNSVATLAGIINAVVICIPVNNKRSLGLFNDSHCECVYNMRINRNKTKVTVYARNNKTTDVTLREEILKQVQEFRYLRTTITDNGRSKTEIR